MLPWNFQPHLRPDWREGDERIERQRNPGAGTAPGGHDLRRLRHAHRETAEQAAGGRSDGELRDGAGDRTLCDGRHHRGEAGRDHTQDGLRGAAGDRRTRHRRHDLRGLCGTHREAAQQTAGGRGDREFRQRKSPCALCAGPGRCRAAGGGGGQDRLHGDRLRQRHARRGKDAQAGRVSRGTAPLLDFRRADAAAGGADDFHARFRRS